MTLGDTVVVIARLDTPESQEITLQDFIIDGQSVIPLFSDESHFRAEVAGSGFEKQGVALDRAFLASILKGSERLLLNPGSHRLVITKANIEAGHL